MLHQRLAPRDGVGIAVDAQEAAIGGFQNGAGITAAAEGAVDIGGAVMGMESLNHFGPASPECDRSCRSPAGIFTGAQHALFHAGQSFGFDRGVAFPVPDLEFLRLADKGDAVRQAGMFDHRVRQAHAALFVGHQQLGARDQRRRLIVKTGGEKRGPARTGVP